ncbi:MAG TPA: nucleotidyl transferase AbiEii/AbiGii toxin family protein, partial [Armatimonadota bacterium]|nr:nucleotidyl transferase AbiEii/AbiGii toxin family protein [Armatimonadota bacterium]
MSGTGEPGNREIRRARIARGNTLGGAGSPFELSAADARLQQEHFGVAPDQILHDFVISHVLAALEPLSDRFVFYGGTALSRTLLNGLRLSEDIDLLSTGPRAEPARLIDSALSGLQRGLGSVSADVRLQDVTTDTAPCTYRIGEVPVRIQLISAAHYPTWPTQRSMVAQRYSGLPDLELQTYTAEGFVAAKTVAWCDSTRNAPRDLYDLWALAERGFVTAG